MRQSLWRPKEDLVKHIVLESPHLLRFRVSTGLVLFSVFHVVIRRFLSCTVLINHSSPWSCQMKYSFSISMREKMVLNPSEKTSMKSSGKRHSNMCCLAFSGGFVDVFSSDNIKFFRAVYRASHMYIRIRKNACFKKLRSTTFHFSLVFSHKHSVPELWRQSVLKSTPFPIERHHITSMPTNLRNILLLG